MFLCPTIIVWRKHKNKCNKIIAVVGIDFFNYKCMLTQPATKSCYGNSILSIY